MADASCAPVSGNGVPPMTSVMLRGQQAPTRAPRGRGDRGVVELGPDGADRQRHDGSRRPGEHRLEASAGVVAQNAGSDVRLDLDDLGAVEAEITLDLAALRLCRPSVEDAFEAVCVVVDAQMHVVGPHMPQHRSPDLTQRVATATRGDRRVGSSTRVDTRVEQRRIGRQQLIAHLHPQRCLLQRHCEPGHVVVDRDTVPTRRGHPVELHARENAAAVAVMLDHRECDECNQQQRDHRARGNGDAPGTDRTAGLVCVGR